jgi:hypothetical protein
VMDTQLTYKQAITLVLFNLLGTAFICYMLVRSITK